MGAASNGITALPKIRVLPDPGNEPENDAQYRPASAAHTLWRTRP